MKERYDVQVSGKQILRSGTSVAANYREASRARSKADFISKIDVCTQEADETLLWLEVLSEGCKLNLEAVEILKKDSELIESQLALLDNSQVSVSPVGSMSEALRFMENTSPLATEVGGTGGAIVGASFMFSTVISNC